MLDVIFGEDGKPRRVPTRFALQINDEADAMDELERNSVKRFAERVANPYLERLDRIHKFIQNAHADMRTILKENNLNDVETRKIFTIAEDLKKFEDELRELSFKHALKEDF